MECVLIFFTILALLVAAVGAVTRRGSGKSQRRRNYQRIAKRFNGRYQAGGIFSRPSVIIPYGTTRAVLKEVSAHGPYEGLHTQLLIQSPDKQLHCEFLPRESLPNLAQSRRLNPVSIDEGFDESVAVLSNSLEGATRLATDGVCWQITLIMRLNEDADFFVRFQRGQILVEKAGPLRDYDSLEALVTSSLDLYDQFMLTRAEGINFVESDAIQTLETVMCTVCGEEVTDRMVYCRRCKTPYHIDCWEYTGGCAVFGCHETSFLRPLEGAPAEQEDSLGG